MTGLQVIACGPGVSIQDRGRFGYRRFGVSTSGAMDQYSLAVANALVGNPPNTAAIEMPVAGASFRVVGGPVLIAVAGLGTRLTVSSRRIAPETSAFASDGEDIVVAPARQGVYNYLAISGGILSQPVLGSRSCHQRSGLGGQLLSPGSVITCEPAGVDKRPMRYVRKAQLANGPIRALPGPQADMFASEVIEAFFRSAHSISSQSDRMGLSLIGEPLPALGGHDIVSDGVVPGSVQVPGDGRPIVLMRDAQTTGGYPKIATVISADLDRLAQIPLGQQVRFQRVSLSDAVGLAGTAARTLLAISDQVQAADQVTYDLYDQNLISGVTRGEDL